MKVKFLRYKDIGAFVTLLQTHLSYWGLYPKSKIDGLFGDNTLAAVKKFAKARQENNQYAVTYRLKNDGTTSVSIPLRLDGNVDLDVWRELLKQKDIEYHTNTSGLITSVEFRALAKDTEASLADLNNCLSRFSISTPKRITHFLAQCAHETNNFQWFLEHSSGTRYEGREDLGNTVEGDGVRYKGAGALQLTGRYNYQSLASYVNDYSIVKEGANVVAKLYPFTSAGLWWHQNSMNALVDKGATVEEVTRIVNGGYNGLEDRISHYIRIKHILGFNY